MPKKTVEPVSVETAFNSYVLGEVLGQGGAGKVYRVVATQVGAQLTDAEVTSMYECRSTYTHGLGFEQLSADQQKLYETQENLLRDVLRAVLDRAFALQFADEGSIRASLPL